nr:hypothetical protein [Kitasatospora sp. SUK 42]
MGVAEERGLPAPEGVVGDRHRDRHVDADHADLHLELEAPGRAAVVGEEGGAVAVRVGVDERQALLVGGDADDGEDRAEDLVVVDGHAGLHVVEQRGAEPETVGGRGAVLVLGGDRVLAPVHGELGAVGDAGLDVGGDLVAVLAGDQRTHLRVAVAAGADLEGRHPLLDLLDQLVADRVDRDQDGDGHAALPGRTEAGVDGGVGGEVEVGVRQDQHVVLGAAQGLHALAVAGAGLVDVAGDRGGADEADGLDVRVLQQAVHGHLVAVHDVEDAVRQAGLLPQSGQEVGRGRVLLGGLHHDGVAGRDGDREEPHRHHGREVERRDDRDRAERLADRVDVDAGGRLLGEAALEQLRDAAGVLDDLQAAGDLAQRVRVHLAVLGDDDRGQLVAAGVQQLTEGEEHRRPLGHRGGAPLGEGRGGGGHGLVDLGDLGEVHVAGDLAGGRVEDVTTAGRRTGGGDRLAADPVNDVLAQGTSASEVPGGVLPPVRSGAARERAGRREFTGLPRSSPSLVAAGARLNEQADGDLGFSLTGRLTTAPNA